jgi:SNF2 family DNA or RNA helicase
LPVPFPTQITGAQFLAERQSALLADEPRVGKTGAAIMAADYNLEEKVLIVTTASGRPIWRRAIGAWSPYGRETQVIAKGTDKISGKAASVIVGWGGVTDPKIRSQLINRKWDRLILDEGHYAKSIETKRTQAAYGDFTLGGQLINDSAALTRAADYKVWCLTGTPLPNSPADIYPMLRALAPHKLHASADAPDVTKYQDFLHRYCVVRMKKISNFRKIPVVVGGRNLEELRARIGDFMLRRTQQDVGIRAPIYETLPLAVSPAMRREVEDKLDAKTVLAAAEAGDTKTLEMELGPLRRLTGEIKAHAVVAAVKEEFECGLDKIVLAYWHKDVGQVLKDGLSTYGVVGIDGSTPANIRGEAEQRFLHDPSIRVFLGQIKAAGEAIDLSSSSNLWFVETSFTPSDMAQMSKRVTNLLATRQAFVRVAVLEGSIDEALQEILLRKWSAIREVLST